MALSTSAIKPKKKRTAVVLGCDQCRRRKVKDTHIHLPLLLYTTCWTKLQLLDCGLNFTLSVLFMCATRGKGPFFFFHLCCGVLLSSCVRKQVVAMEQLTTLSPSGALLETASFCNTVLSQVHMAAMLFLPLCASVRSTVHAQRYVFYSFFGLAGKGWGDTILRAIGPNHVVAAKRNNRVEPFRLVARHKQEQAVLPKGHTGT